MLDNCSNVRGVYACELFFFSSHDRKCPQKKLQSSNRRETRNSYADASATTGKGRYQSNMAMREVLKSTHTHCVHANGAISLRRYSRTRPTCCTMDMAATALCPIRTTRFPHLDRVISSPLLFLKHLDVKLTVFTIMDEVRATHPGPGTARRSGEAPANLQSEREHGHHVSPWSESQDMPNI